MVRVLRGGITAATVAGLAASCAVPPHGPPGASPPAVSPPAVLPPVQEASRVEPGAGGYGVQQYGALFSGRSRWVYQGNSWRYLYPGQYNFSGWVYTLLPWWGWVWVWLPASYTGWIYVWSFGWAYIGGFGGYGGWGGPWGGPWSGGPGAYGGPRWSGGRPLLARPGATVDVATGFSARGAEGATRTLRAPASAPGAPPFGGGRPSGGPSGGGHAGGPPGSGGPPGFTPGGGPMGGPPGGPPQ